MHHGMKCNFSWAESAKKYVELYEKAKAKYLLPRKLIFGFLISSIICSPLNQVEELYAQLFHFAVHVYDIED